MTYRRLDDRSERLAAQLLAGGLRRGDRVATLTGNSPEHVEALFACAKAGLVLVPLSWRLSPAELAFQLDDSEPAVLLVEDEYAAPRRRRPRRSDDAGLRARVSATWPRRRRSWTPRSTTTTRCS